MSVKAIAITSLCAARHSASIAGKKGQSGFGLALRQLSAVKR